MFRFLAFWKKWRIYIICTSMCVFSIASLILGISEHNFEWGAVVVFLFFFGYLLAKIKKSHPKFENFARSEKVKEEEIDFEAVEDEYFSVPDN